MNLKKLTSLLLTLVMVVSLVPMAAFAQEAQLCIAGCIGGICVDGCDGTNHTVGCTDEGCVDGCDSTNHTTGCTAGICADGCDGANHIVGCTAEAHAANCPNAQPASTCVEGCSEEAHVLGCDKYVAPEQPADETQQQGEENQIMLLADEGTAVAAATPTIGSYSKRTVTFDTSIAKIADSAFYIDNSTPQNGYAVAGLEWIDAISAEKYLCKTLGNVNFTCNEMRNDNTGDKSYLYRPVYVVNIIDGAIVSVADDAELFVVGANAHETPDWITIEKVNISTDDNNPIYAFRLSIVEPAGLKLVPSMRIHVRLALFIGGVHNGNFAVGTDTYNSYNINVENYWANYGNGMEKYAGVEAYFDTTASAQRQDQRYLMKYNTVTDSVSRITTADIDVSTLDISTTSDSVKVAYNIPEDGSYVGYTLTLDQTKLTSEEIRITFQDKYGDNCYIYGPVLFANKVDRIEAEATVSNVEDFLYTYRTMAAGTIYLEPETYTFTDTFVHSNEAVNVVGIEENGVKPTFKSTGDAVITVKGDTFMNAKIKNIIIDGENARIGIKGVNVSENNIAAFDVESTLIKNCTTGAVNEGDLARLRNCTFDTNEIAVKTEAGALSVESSVFKNNTKAAVYVSANTTNELIARPSIKNSSFIGNAKDVLTANSVSEVQMQQNFFGDTETSDYRAPKMFAEENTSGDVSKIYYQPHYTTAARTVLDATLDGAQIKAAATSADPTTYYLPVDLSLNANSTLKNNIFGLISDNQAVEIYVMSADREDTATWVYNKADLSKTMDFTATTTNIAVGDGLSDTAGTTVTNKVGDATVYQTINFAHSGSLPGDARITVDGALDTTAADADLYLYHIDGDKLTLEADAEIEVKVDTEAEVNYYSFTSDHCSEYIISTMIVEDTTDDETGGETGGTTGGATSAPSGSTGSSTSSSSSAATATPAPTATVAPTTAVTKPTASANDFVSAVEIEEKLNNAADTTVKIDVSKKDLVSAKAFQLLAENQDKTLVFETDAFSWTFAAGDITDADAISGSAFKPTISLDSPNVDAIKALVGDAAENFTHIYFEHHGKLPGKAKVCVFVGADEAGATKHVYHHLPAENGFEYIDTITLTAEGWAEFEIYGCSDYILSDVLLDASLVIEAEAETPEVNVGDTETEVVPETPAETEKGIGAMPIIVVVAVIAIAAIVFLVKRKKDDAE